MLPHPRRRTNNFTESPYGGLTNRNERASTIQEVRAEEKHNTWTRLELLCQISQITDGNTGVGIRRFHSNISQVLDPMELTEVFDLVTLSEGYRISNVQSFRNEAKKSELKV